MEDMFLLKFTYFYLDWHLFTECIMALYCTLCHPKYSMYTCSSLLFPYFSEVLRQVLLFKLWWIRDNLWTGHFTGFCSLMAEWQFLICQKKENRFPLFRHTWLLFAHLQSLCLLCPIALITAFTVDMCKCFESWELLATSDKRVWERDFLIKYFSFWFWKKDFSKYDEHWRNMSI